MTGSIERAIAETDRRRDKQTAYNRRQRHHAGKRSRSTSPTSCSPVYERDHVHGRCRRAEDGATWSGTISARSSRDMEKRMRDAAANLEFEEAARLRDEVKRLKAVELAVMDDPLARDAGTAAWPPVAHRAAGGRLATTEGAKPPARARPAASPEPAPSATRGRNRLRGQLIPSSVATPAVGKLVALRDMTRTRVPIGQRR